MWLGNDKTRIITMQTIATNARRPAGRAGRTKPNNVGGPAEPMPGGRVGGQDQCRAGRRFPLGHRANAGWAGFIGIYNYMENDHTCAACHEVTNQLIT